MAYSVGMVSLGCEKNRVDAEIMMASLEKAGFTLKDDAALADVAIVNTCGFIEAAKQESIEEILELARLKEEGKIRALVVTGCMAERYREEIRRELPEADAVVGIGANGEIAEIVGYDNALYFSRIFRKYTGISPRDYRNREAVRQE